MYIQGKVTISTKSLALSHSALLKKSPPPPPYIHTRTYERNVSVYIHIGLYTHQPMQSHPLLHSFK